MKKNINPTPELLNELLKRPTEAASELEPLVAQVFEEVAQKGDQAVAKYTELFDGVHTIRYRVSEEEIATATQRVPQGLKDSIRKAAANIEKFHRAQQTDRVQVETMPGVVCWQEKKPIEKVGLYIPGGTAPLFSTVLMLAIPAKVAGCKEVIICTPPGKDGSGVNPVILFTASLCGIEKIYQVGGVQAIAAMTLGTETIPAVYKIFGPGNQYVTAAKQWATRYQVSIDMPAGPSELMVVADTTAQPAYVAADLLSQAEHGVDSQVILLSTSEAFCDAVKQEIDRQLPELPRKEIAAKAIANSRMIVVDSTGTLISVINEYGPEHLIIAAENEQEISAAVSNAGSVFLGNYTPESAGDYASGTNHTLPTNGYSRQYSGVNLDSFTKSITYQKINEEGMMALGPVIEEMAEAEGLYGHKNAVTLRLNDLKNSQR
ncbi:histidinol dehydrogenase [Robertkochia sediminum]|uniref:histidinol dehydrogenase n=1 Tax=Robertkochia sediminum TaxID=2785326 RepID=UPI0019347784|nr:histidinol dehydrogenase [Robertkochia sediminum]MBL7473547.1 histidinol dehydrogenase [Robertkochia sediminum]